MPQGEERNGGIPESEENGTKGGSFPILNASIFSKETEIFKEFEQKPQPGALSRSENYAVPGEDPVAAVENEAIEIFTSVARVLGYPRSVGEIFGILFAAEEPMPFEGIARKRGISAGTVSVALRHLRDLGVILVIPIDGDRRDHYAVNDDFGRVHASMVRHHIEPPISASRRRIDRINILADKLSRGNRHWELAKRLRRFAEWQSQLTSLITTVLKLPR
jgi:DNA-binding transcriptional regulator GbsR (MarR family)